MSDTVLIALITFASGAIGSIIGYFTARRSEKVSLIKDARQATYEHRVNAYSACVEAFLATSATGRSTESLVMMAEAFASATIIAPSRTATILKDLNVLVHQKGNLDMERINALEREMLDAMRADLDEFETKPLSGVFRNPRCKNRKKKPDGSASAK